MRPLDKRKLIESLKRVDALQEFRGPFASQNRLKSVSDLENDPQVAPSLGAPRPCYERR